METLTIALLVAIAIFAIGNILLIFLERKMNRQRLPIGSANTEVISSKLDVLNKRISHLEQNRIKEIVKEERKEVIIKEPKVICKPKKEKIENKESSYPITKFKRKSKK